MAAIRLVGVSKHFGDVKAVDDVTLDIADRDFMILLGPSGCGKSTLLRTIAGLEDVTAGEVWIGDAMVNDIEPKDRDVSMVFQSYALYPHKTVRSNIEFPLKVRGIDKAERSKEAEKAAEILGLTPYLDRRPGALSGGQRQRVALARAIVRRPAVFCMDEPLSNLDAKLRSETRAELVALHDRLDATFVYVTHDQVEAMTMGNRIAVMREGKIEQVGTPGDVYAKPATVFVAQFIGTPPMNIFPAGSLESGSHLVGARPEHTTFTDRSDQSVAATVSLVEHLGHELQVVCRIDDDHRAIVRMPAEATCPESGTAVRLAAEAAHRHRFDAVSGSRIDG